MSLTSSTRERERHFVQSLERGLVVIRVLSSVPETEGLTLTEVARATGLTRAAARRFLLTLSDLGYVRLEDRHFSLTPRVLELGYSFLSSLTLPDIAQPHLRELVQQVHESSSVSVLDGTDVVYIAREPTRRIMTVAIAVGTRFPAYATSMGRVLLGGLDTPELDDFFSRAELRRLTSETLTSERELRRMIARVRTQGWALVDQELEEGLRSIAAPIHDATGNVVAAVNLSSQARRWTTHMMVSELLAPLLQTAARIERDLIAGARQGRN